MLVPCETHLTLDQVRARAQADADAGGIPIAIGWQQNDATGARELGWCPASVAPHPAFVVEVLETIQPYTGGRSDHDARQERRRERLEGSALRAAGEASSRFRRARSAIAGIPPGQPILVGHHSERHHRRDLEKHDTNMRAGIDAEERARELASRAAGVGTGGISSDDPAAVQKLRTELASLEALQMRMKAANKIVRKLKRNPEACVLALQAEGFSEGQSRRLLEPDFCGRIGFADYQVKNNNANMRRIRGRIQQLQAVASVPEGEQARSRSGVVYRIEDNRVQLVFGGKPSADIRERLKSHGFRWSPTAGAWQRQLNGAGQYAAQTVIQWLDQQER